MKALVTLVASSENWLVRQVLGYAKERGYTKYTLTLEEAWQESIAGLSALLLSALRDGRPIQDLTPDEDLADEPVVAFGILEAERHRARGMTFPTYLGLMKYYRRAYLDLIRDANLDVREKSLGLRRVENFFDRMEIGLCAGWVEKPASKVIEELQNANRELEAFSYSVSHDLRSPLWTIDGFSRILLDDYADSLDPEGKRFLGIIRTSTQRMSELIDDLLTFSRVGRKELEKTGVDMGELARVVFAEMSQMAQDRDVKTVVNKLPPAFGDYSMIHQVYTNLISNAFKFTRGKTSPEIELGAFEEGSETVYYVKDNGVGFDMQYEHKLFGVFQRLHSAEEFEGTGVGLAMARRIIHRHGGRVWAEGQVGQGATFYFTLPSMAAANPAIPRASIPNSID